MIVFLVVHFLFCLFILTLNILFILVVFTEDVRGNEMISFEKMDVSTLSINPLSKSLDDVSTVPPLGKVIESSGRVEKVPRLQEKLGETSKQFYG